MNRFHGRTKKKGMPGGDIVTKVKAKKAKVTHRQYMKKDGTPGKQTITFMQPDDGILE